MLSHRMRPLLLAFSAVIVMSNTVGVEAAGPDAMVSDRVKMLTRGTQWRQVAAIPLGFDTQHPQGMVKIGDDFYVSSVEIKTPTKRIPRLFSQVQ